MVLKPDQERVKALLKETITLLCKNGLQFKNQFSIEAVIGVTLDEEEVFLVSVNELISADTRKSSGGDDQQMSPGSSASKTNHKRHRKRKHAKTGSGGESGEEASLSSDDGSSGDDDAEGGDETGSGTTTPSEKRQCKPEHQEQPAHSNNGNENKSGIQIKEEVDDCVWTNPNRTTSQQLQPPSTNFTTSSTYTAPEQSLADLPDINMIQAGLITSQAQWLQQQDLQGTAYTMAMARTPRTSTVTSANVSQTVDGDNMNMNQDSQQSRLCPSRKKRFHCSTCSKSFSTAWNLHLHEDGHKGKYPYVCQQCGRGFYTQPDLRGHMSYHTGVKEFHCHVCNKDFRHKKNLKQHLAAKHIFSL